ncbi:hypothetical protein LR48_Vigan08g089400 [Vigna angularis]|uniref:Uncharacterized protein n=1 Tax=Phaseolus angularis TaxID=3914 RepID=A0A0L9V550_PHAAN|nr:hypothetical protein LR48_Vigan08g089400 [Vigna angularis]
MKYSEEVFILCEDSKEVFILSEVFGGGVRPLVCLREVCLISFGFKRGYWNDLKEELKYQGVGMQKKRKNAVQKSQAKVEGPLRGLERQQVKAERPFRGPECQSRLSAP